MTESQTETTSSPYADALAEIERLRDVVRDAAALLEAKSDRKARREWARVIRERGERP